MTSEANLWWPRLHIAERSRCLAGSLAGFHCQMCRSRVSVDSLVMEVFGRTLETKLRHDFAPALPAGRLVLWPCSAVTPLDMKNIEKTMKNMMLSAFASTPGVWSMSLGVMFIYATAIPNRIKPLTRRHTFCNISAHLACTRCDGALWGLVLRWALELCKLS